MVKPILLLIQQQRTTDLLNANTVDDHLMKKRQRGIYLTVLRKLKESK